MSNLTYNPNINMDFDNSGGNFRNNNSYDSPQLLQPMDPRTPMQQMRQPAMQPMMQQPMRQYENYDYDEPPMPRRRKRTNYNNIDKFEETPSTKFDWILLIKKI